MKNDHVLRGSMCALLGGISWGFSGTCAQFLMSNYHVSALWITCARMLFAAVFFLAVIVVRDFKSLIAISHDWRSLVMIVIFSLFGVFLVQIAYLKVIGYTNSGTGTMFEQTGLVLIMLYVCIQEKRFPKLREVIGLVLAFAGMVAISTQGHIGGVAIPLKGLIWGIISAVGYALYALLPVALLKKWDSIMISGLSMLFGGVIASLAVQPWKMPVPMEPGLIGAVAAIILIGTFLSYILYLQAIHDAGPLKTSLLCSVEPASAMVISAVWLGTHISIFDVVGCILIIAMVFFVTQREATCKDKE